MNILISPNAFKNSVNSEAAASAIKEGFVKSQLDCHCHCFPIGDGGDGTANLIINKLGGKLIETEVHDPFGRKIKTCYGLIDGGKTAVIEMANSSGLRLLKSEELNTLKASSYGTGEQIKLALNRGVKKIIIGMGGSATVDGGCGILSALGFRFLNAYGKYLYNLPADLPELHSIEIPSITPKISDCEIIVLCDVDNKLLGEQGAAKIFGPQKGASADDVRRLEIGLSKYSIVIFHKTAKDISEIKCGGTAGGAAAGLYALLDAKLVNGIEYFLDLTGFDQALATSDLLITGEGSIDEQTLLGKGPFGVALRAKQRGLPVIGLAGKVPLHISEGLHRYFDVLIPVCHEPLDIASALKSASANLSRTAFEIGNILSLAVPFGNSKRKTRDLFN